MLKEEGYEIVSTIPNKIDMEDYKDILGEELLHLKSIFKKRRNIDKDNEEKSSKEIDYWINKQIKDIKDKLNFYDFYI